MDLSGTHGKRLDRKYRFYENRERTVYFPRNGRRDESPPYAYPLASQVPRATGRNGTGCDLGTDRLHQLGLRYTAKRRLAALERLETKDRWRILCPMDSA